MSNLLKRRTPESKTDDTVVPYAEILAEEEAERLQMHLDLESGRITPAALRKRNCIDWGDTTLVPLHEERRLRSNRNKRPE